MKSIYFDNADRTLLSMVNSAISNKTNDQSGFDTHLHPHGIIELTTTHEYRMAHATVHLLSMLKAEEAQSRLDALITLRDEVLHSARTQFRYNTGRVLLQLMKEIIRKSGDIDEQLKLMHDFRKATSGNPLVVRRLLARYYLLEMPEDRSQLAMDHHVHDANTKGRKNPTHLIMDAWIKGITKLTVVYYNYIDPLSARELLQAAEIMNITIRIGIEFCTVFRNKFVCFVWTPRGFTDTEDFLNFLDERQTIAIMNEGKAASKWTSDQIFKILDEWNSETRFKYSTLLKIDLPIIQKEQFIEFVGMGQPSLLHLAEFIHKQYFPLLKNRVDELKNTFSTASSEEQKSINETISTLNLITSDTIHSKWLSPENIKSARCLRTPDRKAGMPKIMTLPPAVLLDWLSSIRSGYRITLQLKNLTKEDVLELLWDGEGTITHLELFNLKEWQEGHLAHLTEINELQNAINTKNTIRIKRMMLTMMQKIKQEGDEERFDKFTTILNNLNILQSQYKSTNLRSHIGTDSTSNPSVRHGMGLVVTGTLPPRARAYIKKNSGYRPVRVPIHMELSLDNRFTKKQESSFFAKKLTRFISKIPGLKTFGTKKKTEWHSISTSVSRKNINVITMGGGLDSTPTNNFIDSGKQENQKKKPGILYINSALWSWMKVIAGFIPAQLAFLYTDGWWFLTYFGALIWYFITLFRNIVQAFLSGGGLVRSMLTWKEYVSWHRIADSLFYTGVSVWVLEVMVRRWLLEVGMGVTVENNAVLVYTVLALCNGVYISAHNVIRGFPKEAIVANLFRSAFAIPLSWILGEGIFHLFGLAGFADPIKMTQNCAAITSKCASDIVAAVIEGIADSNQNRRLRLWDYSTKLRQIFENYTEMELAMPNKDLFSLMKSPEAYLEEVEKIDPKRLRICALNALDMMYLWMYQPYAQQTLRYILFSLSMEERIFIKRSQTMLKNTKFISTLFVNGIVGPNFCDALAFYLKQHQNYITALNKQINFVSKKLSERESIDIDEE